MSDPDGLRAAVLRLTTGVTVLTSCHEGRMHGSTISSTSLVSRDPMTVAAGLRQGSELSELAWRSGWFAVNVLAGRQAMVADWFADPERPRGLAQFEPLDWEPDPQTGLPLLRQAPAQLICRVLNRIPIGDHDDLLLAEVVRGRSGSGSPLISHQGALYSAELRDVVRRRRSRSLTTAAAVALD
ncbi:flavin reductase (DIM6/NTAB) family NADH-FMN oxidoreductase RutF [Kitasatospora sp. MAA4]|uniref:flavin reductase family protein n=1 Tax=Kitasatospora sp. MAA4 TaxID=3035093 RepID=UPI002476BEDD|nr:flavin reductase family protein [Kitasatospora sp. MAA4]MDH6135460.1 flavin reductase (DIM6/NTAB) family NADH-FMN oxidoreductase RutF [Kitasatospora sp. MAA4]